MEGRDGLRVAAVTLRDVVEDDIQTFYRHQSDPLSIEMAQVAPRDAAAYLARWTRLLADETVGTRTIVVDGNVAGHVMSFDRDGVRELGYWLGREFWGQGITGAAVQQYLALEPRRPLFAIVAEQNIASRRILSRCGFREFSKKGDVLRYQLSAGRLGPPEPSRPGRTRACSRSASRSRGIMTRDRRRDRGASAAVSFTVIGNREPLLPRHLPAPDTLGCTRNGPLDRKLREYIRIGVDGAITDDVGDLRCIAAEGEFAPMIRFATRDDNPDQPANFGYGLLVHTGDKWMAGTDANVTFTVTGASAPLARRSTPS